MIKLFKAIKKLFINWRFRKYSDSVCCCGSNLEDHSLSENHGFKSMREYAIECHEEEKNSGDHGARAIAEEIDSQILDNYKF